MMTCMMKQIVALTCSSVTVKKVAQAPLWYHPQGVIIVVYQKGEPMKRKNMTPEQIKQKREEIKFIRELNKREAK